MDTWGFWEGWDDWNQEGLIESSALYHNRKQDIKWQTNGPPRLLRGLLLYKVNWLAFHRSAVAFGSSSLYPLAMANWAMSDGDKWAGRRDKKGWIKTQRRYFSSFSELPVWKTDSKQGAFHIQERRALELQPTSCHPSIASPEHLQCDTKAWQGSLSSEFAPLLTCTPTSWWQLLTSKVFIEVTDSIRRRVFKNRRDLILYQRPPRFKRIKRIVWPCSVIKWSMDKNPVSIQIHPQKQNH